MASMPARTARLAASTKPSRTRSMSAAVISRGTGQSGPNAMADGAIVSQASSPGASACPPSQGRRAEALRPAWASWMPSFARAVAAAMGDDARERRFAVVGIEPEAAVADAAAALDAGRLDHDQRGAGIGEHAEMIDVPVGGDAVVGAVLAHGRDDDAVRELEIGEPDRRKQGTGHVTRVELEEGSQRTGTIGNGAPCRKRLTRAITTPLPAREEMQGRRKGGFKPPCGEAHRRQAGLAPPRHHPPPTARSRPIARSAGWPRACDGGIAPRCNNASSARCDRARGNERVALGQGAPFLRDLVECMPGQPCRHGEAVASRWSRRVIVASEHAQATTALLAGTGCARITQHRIAVCIIIRFGRM